ncbi:MAG: DUF92 domain-containing protein [Anaerolineae bacterium]|nr:DUF92 domain-containing protein [Anaerolineae bacterium]
MESALVGAWSLGLAQKLVALELQLLIGLLLSVAVAWLGYRLNSLSEQGMYGAIAVGTLTFGFGGWPWGLLLVAFFVTSSVLSRYRFAEKRAATTHFAKTGRRDLGQVLANGGLGALLALWYGLSGGAHLLLFFAFAGAMAAVNADTWATELGVLSRRKPRLITSGERVEPGASGAVSKLGLIASLAGAWLIGFLGLAFQVIDGRIDGIPHTGRLVWLPLAAAVGGMVGSLVDSLLGATLQAIYYCPHCGKETEQPVHRCGRQPIYVRGLHWLDNDWVNLFSSVAGALVAAFAGTFALFLR